ncbi:glycerophosphodiester phosphodiesterase family protein [Oryzibacter oryziterrae]|uniref:glycerophosphodiester phosphodiesterase family protein n=1 Tax=Oryzibacter oryziterrae TaxID=2766474 RepID=UPI001F2C6F61|nr:glycerophosphodiester phosphodiesterase family protein [Oryzibacter oryziterrae]
MRSELGGGNTARPSVVVDTRVIAHRGAPRVAPENTLAAIRAAAAAGASWVEVDVKLTADRQPVIIHDDKVDRTTNGKGFVAGLGFEDIRRLDARAHFGPEFAGIQIPTLRELLETVLELDLGLQLELKPTAGDDVETAEVALAQLKDIWPASRGRLFVSSFSIRSIHAAARLMPEVPRCFAVCVPPRDPRALLEETRCQLLHCIVDLFDADAEARVSASGIEYGLAVVNDLTRGRQLIAGGAQTLITDIPDLAV